MKVRDQSVRVMLSIILLAPSGSLGAFYAGPGVTAKEIIEARNYLAEEHHFNCSDGYQLLITRATNPQINAGKSGLAHRDVILFIHGIFEDSSVFVINSMNLTGPSDFSALNASDPATGQRLLSEGSARSLVFLSLDFGHEVWLLNRRGFPGSQLRVGPRAQNTSASSLGCGAPRRRRRAAADEGAGLEPLLALPGAIVNEPMVAPSVAFSFDPDFWDYSFDEQASFDIPEAIQFVLKQTNRTKLSTVTHSAGGSILLMALANQPDLANKLSNNVLWAEGFRLGINDNFEQTRTFRSLLEAYDGSVPPAFTTTRIQAFLGVICGAPGAPRTLCAFFADLILGESGGQEPILPEFINVLLYATSSFELAQLYQNVDKNMTMHRYDYGACRNRAIYGGQAEPPVYDLGQVQEAGSLSFYAGRTDRLVSRDDVEQTLPLLKVPYKYHLVDAIFNHQGYFYHDDNAALVILPSMRDLQTSN